MQVLGGGFLLEDNPFTPKPSLIRYWNKQIRSDYPKSEFLLSKASPLTAVDTASFAKLAATNSLSSRLPHFCSSANLFCFPDLSPSLEKHSSDVGFSLYDQKNFTNYGSSLAGSDSFKNYSLNGNGVVDSFRAYSRDSLGHKDKFANYASGSNVVDEQFNTYGSSTTGGSGDFKNYHTDVNNPTSRFTSYSDDTNGRSQSFSSYSRNAKARNGQSFTSYGKTGNGAQNEFSSYAVSSNVVGSGFKGYGDDANAANDTFTNYGSDGNIPQNNFRSYGDGGNAATDTFANYRDQSNVGDDSFSSYAKNSNGQNVNFVNYGQRFNPGSESFTGYGKGGKGQKIGFKIYSEKSTFKDYAKKGVEFSRYKVSSTMAGGDGKVVNKWIEPGKFFRESMLKEGKVMWMRDIRDKMPKRSSLPRSIISKLPFSGSKMSDIKEGVRSCRQFVDGENHKGGGIRMRESPKRGRDKELCWMRGGYDRLCHVRTGSHCAGSNHG